MDLGIFRRNKSTFWAWIVLPALAVVVAYSVSNVYCASVEDRLYRRKAVLGILNDVEAHMKIAKDVVCAFAVMGGGQATAAEDVSTRMSELARRRGFRIDSLQVKDLVNTVTTDEETSQALTIEMQGEGDMLALMQFMNDLHSPQHLTVVDSALLKLQRRGSKTETHYMAELMVRCLRGTCEEGDNG